MARRRNAILTALFGYGQSTIGMALGLLVTRVVLRLLGQDTWGLWVASGALLSYAGLADLGVLGVLPWIIADADGRKDAPHIRAALSHALVFAALAAAGFVLIASILWNFFPALLHLSEQDRTALRGPVFVVIALTAVTFPMRLFAALLTGLQDATFLGFTGLVQVIAGPALTVTLAWSGCGLYALAIGSSAPPVAIALASMVRARMRFGHLVTSWPRPGGTLMRSLAVDGMGTWLGAIGFQLAASADAIILASVGLRGMIAPFAITTRLPLTLMQFGWILPDAALVGLAQLGGEAGRERVREVVLAILRLNLILAGAVASAVLASNAGFVRIWVGSDLYLGNRVNCLLAINVVLMTAIHGLVSVACVFGKRMTVGVVFVVNGVVHIVLASFLGRHIGVVGVASATLLSGIATALPVGMRLLAPSTGITARDILAQVYWPWMQRFLPLAVVAGFLGYLGTTVPIALLTVGCTVFGFAYMWWMKPLYVGLPLGPRIASTLRRFKLLD